MRTRRVEIRKKNGRWCVTNGTITQTCTSWSTAMELANDFVHHTATQPPPPATNICLNEACNRPQTDTLIGVCDKHKPKPKPLTDAEIKARYRFLERLTMKAFSA